MREPIARRLTVREAIHATPRAGYLPQSQQESADVDAPLDLGHGSTCSQPSTVVNMLELLDARPGQRVLDVGSGSGWTTAILARMVGSTGWVLGVDLVPELVRDAGARLRRDALHHAAVIVADPNVVGAPSAGPFDRILVSAMAQTLPGGLVDQLMPDGLMVLPLDGGLVRVTIRAGRPKVHRAPGRYRFVPLRGG